MGKQIAVGAFTGLVVFAALFCLLDLPNLDYQWVYLLGGCSTPIIACYRYLHFPRLQGGTTQHKKRILKNHTGSIRNRARKLSFCRAIHNQYADQ